MNPEAVKLEHEIRLMLLAHPELAEDEILRANMLEGETDLHKALSTFVRLIGEAQGNIDGLAAYVTTLQSRATRFERRIEAIRGLIFKLMTIADLKKVPLPEATISVRNGTRFVVITDETKIPEEFIRVRREPNKSAIKEAIDQGKFVEGAELSNGAPGLTIRVN